MLRTPHLYDSNVAKFPLFASPLSSHTGASCTVASPVLEMGLKWSKQASGSNQQGVVRKVSHGSVPSIAQQKFKVSVRKNACFRKKPPNCQNPAHHGKLFQVKLFRWVYQKLTVG